MFLLGFWGKYQIDECLWSLYGQVGMLEQFFHNGLYSKWISKDTWRIGFHFTGFIILGPRCTIELPLKVLSQKVGRSCSFGN